MSALIKMPIPSSRVAIFVGVSVVCLAIIIPLVAKWNRPIPGKPHGTDSGPHKKPLSHPELPINFFEKPKPSNPTKKSWITTVAPFYVIGAFAYVLYIVYRITTKQSRKIDKNKFVAGASTSQRRIKTLLSSRDLDNLEVKLSASEKAVEEILTKARTVMTEVYQKELENDDESTISDSSDLSNTSSEFDGDTKVIDLATTSSANNDTHQDSSSDSEKHVTRRTHRHKTKPLYEECHSTISSSSDENIIVVVGKPSPEFHSPELSSACLRKEDDLTSSSCGVSDLPPLRDNPDSGSSSDNEASEGASRKKVKVDLGKVPHGDQKEVIMENVKLFEETATSIGEAMPVSREKELFLKDKEELLNTTKQVLNAMSELRSFINEQSAHDH